MEQTRAEGASSSRIQIDHALEQHDPTELLREIREGLEATPRELPCKLFYDDEGSRLFEQICELPEYYQTRTEKALLERYAAEIVELSGADELVELGSGAATKTRVLLDAMQRAGRLHLYVPFDVNEAIVQRTAEELTQLYPELRVHGVIGDFIHHLGRIPEGERRLAVFLGGTIGNFTRIEARGFLERLAAQLEPGDGFLLGIDLIKDRARLEAAYDDAAGVTARFNLNILNVVNQLTGSDFDLRQFKHVAFWNAEARRVEIWIEALAAQRVKLPEIGLELELAQGERIRTEVSGKYDRESAESLLDAAGFEPRRWMTDDERLFGLALGRRR